MAEYIEREEATKKTLDACLMVSHRLIGLGLPSGYGLDIVNMMESIPTADVVPVVRCGNCGYYKDGLCLTLPCNPIVRRQPNDYCSYGRKAQTVSKTEKVAKMKGGVNDEQTTRDSH